MMHKNVSFLLKRSTVPVQFHVNDDDEDEFCFHEHHFDKNFDADDILIPLPPPITDKNSSQTLLKYSDIEFDIKIQKPGLYHLWLSNCQPNSKLSFQMRLSEYNQFGSFKDYLSIGESPLPSLYFWMFIVFVIESIAWMILLSKSNQNNVKSIHYLMAFVVIVKSLSLLFDSMKYSSLKRTGLSHGWSVMFYIFSFVKGMSFFSLLVLIATGWSYMKPFLTNKDRRIIYTVLILQVGVNLAMVIDGEMAPGYRYWLGWHDVLLVFDMGCCVAILIALIARIRHLKTAASANGKAANTLRRLKHFHRFYLLTTAFIYVTRIIVLLLSSLLSFRWFWLAPMLSESASAGFYACTGYWFRPETQTPYIPLEQTELEARRALDEGLPDDDLSDLQLQGDTI